MPVTFQNAMLLQNSVRKSFIDEVVEDVDARLNDQFYLRNNRLIRNDLEGRVFYSFNLKEKPTKGDEEELIRLYTEAGWPEVLVQRDGCWTLLLIFPPPDDEE